MKKPRGRGLRVGDGALDRIRTCGTLLRRQVLYPLSYEGTLVGPDGGALRYYRSIDVPLRENGEIPHR